MSVLTCLLTRPHGRGRAPGAKTRRRARRWQAASGPCKNPRRARWRSGGRGKIVSWGSGQALAAAVIPLVDRARSEEHTSELQSLMRISYAVFCLKKKKNTTTEDNRPYYT